MTSFLETFFKIVILMIIEDLIWFSLGRYTNFSVYVIIPILIVLAALFTIWIVKSGRKKNYPESNKRTS